MILGALHVLSAVLRADEDVAAELDPERRRELERRRRQPVDADELAEAERSA